MHNQKLLSLPYNQSFLPRMTMFRQGTAEATIMALQSTVLSENNQNLSPWK
jgi:hypothetical protein